jgi:hypothetical protein
LFWEKSTGGWLLVAGLFWEKSTAGWWVADKPSEQARYFEALATVGPTTQFLVIYPLHLLRYIFKEKKRL